MTNNKIITSQHNDLYLSASGLHTEGNHKKSNQLNIVKDSIKSLEENSPTNKRQIEEIKESIKELKKLSFNEDVQKKINNGELFVDGVDARNSLSKRYAGKAKVSEIDNEVLDQLDSLEQKKEIAQISRRIGGLVGQAQLYDITEKLENLTKDVQAIRDLLINERESELEAAFSDVKQICIEGNFSDKELDRINSYVHLFNKQSRVFKKELDSKIGKDLYENNLSKIINKFFEGVNFFFSGDSEQERLDEVIQDLTYAQKGYVISNVLLIKCYEILGENKGDILKANFEHESDMYFHRISGYIGYLLKDENTSSMEQGNLELIIGNNKSKLSEDIVTKLKRLVPNKTEISAYLQDYSFDDYCKLIEVL